MAKARESALWDWLSKGRKLLSGQVHMSRVENYVEPGFPDVDGYINAPELKAVGEFTLELKSEDRPKKPGTPIRYDIRHAQVIWNAERWAVGANAFWLLQVGSGHDRTLYLAPGDLGSRLLAGMHEAEIAVECIKTAIFKNQFSQIDVLTKAVTCRANPFLFPK